MFSSFDSKHLPSLMLGSLTKLSAFLFGQICLRRGIILWLFFHSVQIIVPPFLLCLFW